MQATCLPPLVFYVGFLLFIQLNPSLGFMPATPPARLRSPAGGLRCQVKPDEQYLIVPSQLEGTGGGWTIQATRPPPKQGTVWARPRPEVGEVQEMGFGSFGRIYLATDLKTGQEVAVKAERDIGQKVSALRAEAETLIHLQGGPGIADVYWVGKRDLNGENCNILVMELLGPDMEDLLELMDKRSVSTKTGLMLAHQMLDCLSHIHSRGIIHRDIKPENFLMGVKERANKVYLIDYGLSDFFQDEQGNHVPCKKSKDSLRGTLRYASIPKHEGYEQSRRDDLEELMYVLIYLMRGGLPWCKEEAQTFDGLEKQQWARARQMDRVKNLKKNTPMAELCAGLPSVIPQLLQYSRSLSFEDEPDYDGMKQQVLDAMSELGHEMDFCYDWGNKAPPPKRNRFW
ncbi:hypothetical protein GUITHDRAFT_151052 [Guillardia theta CCMP2712]|uniref:non-specific serine/threonine protein kinase n=1 Tax=Guillardia theta (strain CCMP2712) TaxID=905079 RepID=L1JQE3_GUITC|nr:hypothetical protein GUITHDRAFT_151052 [Guillardia theta CCMP2712]EKX50687.1 hypothetical protein GUITHDRAFT_151052 [Guillardia theta CCMP2712]|eukprot:XP_005837667.1 hypothetical protein GUITHDRAFT_151052 [Guillardia theta CCMP2712]